MSAVAFETPPAAEMTEVPLVAVSVHAEARVMSDVPLWSTFLTSVSLGGTAVLVMVHVLVSPPFSVMEVTTPAPQSNPELVQPGVPGPLSESVYVPGDTEPLAPPAPLRGVGPVAVSVQAVAAVVSLVPLWSTFLTSVSVALATPGRTKQVDVPAVYRLLHSAESLMWRRIVCAAAVGTLALHVAVPTTTPVAPFNGMLLFPV